MSMKQQKKKKGQSTLEYIILVTGVVVVLLAFLAPGSGIFNQHFCSTMKSATNGMVNMAERLGGSRYKAK